MGCDIHGFLEVKTENGWFAYKELELDRSYTLFSLMGHRSRGDMDPIAEIRGWPQDASEVSNSEREEECGIVTGEGWITFDEWKQVVNAYRAKYPWKPEEGEEDDIARVLGWRELRSDWCYHDVRLVFWFDN